VEEMVTNNQSRPNGSQDRVPGPPDGGRKMTTTSVLRRVTHPITHAEAGGKELLSRCQVYSPPPPESPHD